MSKHAIQSTRLAQKEHKKQSVYLQRYKNSLKIIPCKTIVLIHKTCIFANTNCQFKQNDC